MFRKIVQVYAVLLIIFISGCEVTTSSAEKAEVVERGEKILIKDRTGKELDVIHAPAWTLVLKIRTNKKRHRGFILFLFRIGYPHFLPTPSFPFLRKEV